MAFTLPWSVNKLVSTHINNGNAIADATYGTSSLKCEGKTLLMGETRIVGNTTANSLTALTLTPTNRNELCDVKYVSANTTLNWGDPENIIFNNNGNYNITLPTIQSGGASRIGARFTFGFRFPYTGTKTISIPNGSGEYIYDGGTTEASRKIITIGMTRETLHTLTLLCIAVDAGNPVWEVVTRHFSPATPFSWSALQTFTGGITASSAQTINFGTNAVTMSGANISATSIPNTALQTSVVLTTNSQSISGLKAFTGGLTASATQTIDFGSNAPTMSGANIQGTSVPNSALQTSVVLTTGTQLITGAKSFSLPPSMEGTNIAGVVKTTGNENIDGIKIFSSPPVMSGASITATSIPNTALQTSVVLTNNTQTITGAKTFSSPPTMSGANIALTTIPANSIIGADIDTTLSNTSFGETTGFYGTGGFNSVFGSLAMQQGTLVSGSENCAYGAGSLAFLESGQLNCAFGTNTGQYLVSGQGNSIFGSNAGNQVQLNGQNNNTLIGQGCGSSGTFSNCTGLGQNVQFSTGVTNSTAIGRGTLCSNSNSIQLGDNNITVRISGALVTPTPISTSNSTNAATTAFVYGKIRVDDVLNNQSCGLDAGASFTTGNQNVSIASLSNFTMTTGYKNVSIGHAASRFHNGFQNIAIGTTAMQSSVGQVPTNNVAIGEGALSVCLTGADGNFALGVNSLGTLSIGTNNVMVGYYSGGALTTGNYNNGIGYGALNTITTGDRNCGIGIGVGGGITTGSKNTFLGDNTSSTGDFSNSTAIGADSQITANNQIVIGTANESIFVRGCTYLKSAAPIQTGSFTISSTLIYENYPINITATSTVTLPTASAALVGVTIRFRRIAGSAVALNSSASNIRPATSVTTSNAVILTASNTTSVGNSMSIICLPLTASTYSWHDAA